MTVKESMSKCSCCYHFEVCMLDVLSYRPCKLYKDKSLIVELSKKEEKPKTNSTQGQNPESNSLSQSGDKAGLQNHSIVNKYDTSVLKAMH